ncbi:hypothetical protein N665_0134s0018 [Sinapis alba]|nr:hypothetical protein N665_0134s0018 [Sinapis alba]
MSAESWTKGTHAFEGFGWAIMFWALCSVPHLCTICGEPDETTTASEDPLMLRWTSTETPQAKKIMAMENNDDIMVGTIIGDPEKHKNLVPPTDCKADTFMEVVERVKNGNRLKKTDWINGYVYFCDATEDIGNKSGKKDLSLDQKVHMLTEMVQLLTNKVNSIENLLLDEFKKRTNTKPAGFNNDDSTDEKDSTKDFPSEDDRSREDVDENPVDAERDSNAENLADGDS